MHGTDVDGAAGPDAPRSGAEPRGTRRFEDLGAAPTPAVLGWQANALRFLTRPIPFMKSLRERHGNVALLARGGNPSLFNQPFPKRQIPRPATVFAFGPECNQRILTDLESFQNREPRGPKSPEFEALSTNILFSNGDEHRRRRRQLMALLSGAVLKTYHGTMVEFARRMMDGWRDGDVVDIEREMASLSTNIASKCLYGLDASKASENLAARMSDMVNALFSPVNLIPLAIPGTPYHRLLRNIREIKNDLSARISESADSDRTDLLSIIVRQQLKEVGELDPDDLVGDFFVLFFAGHDTIHDALSWTLLLLAQHPRVMEELMAELDGEVSGEAPTYDQLFVLPVLDRVVKESLRVLSPGLIFPRVAARDTELGGFAIPAGTEVVYSPYMTHVDPDVYEHASRFDPDRWTTIKPSVYEYLPFSAGRRMCLGAALGQMMLKVLVPMIVRRFRLEALPRKIDIRFHAVMGPKGGLPMRLRRQDGAFGKSVADLSGEIADMVDWRFGTGG
ncbi:MAG: cytochrome P450 [Acidobacteriota bacterium]